MTPLQEAYAASELVVVALQDELKDHIEGSTRYMNIFRVLENAEVARDNLLLFLESTYEFR